MNCLHHSVRVVECGGVRSGGGGGGGGVAVAGTGRGGVP